MGPELCFSAQCHLHINPDGMPPDDLLKCGPNITWISQKRTQSFVYEQGFSPGPRK